MTYWIIDAICYLAALLYVLTSLLQLDLAHVTYGVLSICAYPLALETIANLWTKTQTPHHYSVPSSSRFVYHNSYSMSLWGFQKQHPFDSSKYARIYRKIIERGLLPHGVIEPQIIPRSLLLEKMKVLYLFKLNYSPYLTKLLEIPYWWIPNWIFKWKVVQPMMRATEGSILAALAALKVGWAVNLSGGFHHASFGQGGGFCLFPDISLIVHYLHTRTLIRRIMIIDLDAHQGDGFERDLIINDNVYIVDCYNSKIYPQDHESKDAIMKSIRIKPTTSNQQYLKFIDSLQLDFDFYQPEFVIYNAGTDIMEGDPIGQLSMSKDTVIRRDEKVLEMSRSRGVPLVMLLSGGYQDLTAEVIGDSLCNLYLKFG